MVSRLPFLNPIRRLSPAHSAYKVRAATSAPVLAGYKTQSFATRHRGKLLLAFCLLLIVYSFLFTLFGRFLMVQFLAPLMVAALFVIWLLPQSRRVPTRALQFLLSAYVFALLCWPDYLALSLPGLPWITAIRLVGIPMALVFMVCLSVSNQFRSELLETINAVPFIWKGLLGFTLLAIISVAFSTDVSASMSKLLLALVNWTMMFFCAAYVFRTPGRVIWLGYALWGIAIFLCLIALQEWRHSLVPWAGHIPSFLAIEDESVQKILSGSSRAATGIYRVQSKFTTPLSFAEFLSLVLPFVLSFTLNTRRIKIVFLGLISIVFFIFTIVNTDARLGMVGLFSTLLLMLLVWGAQRWGRNRDSIFGPAIVLSFPTAVVVFLIASRNIGRLRTMVWGNGAQQFSDDARRVQWEMGIPMIVNGPLGHGIGRGAATLGYTNLGGVLTIDSYYLSILLEVGVLGFCLYFGIFIVGIFNAGRVGLRAKDTDISMLAPISIALINFIIIKGVLSQQETHPLAFILLGAIVALIWRSRLADNKTHAPTFSAATRGREGRLPKFARLGRS